MRRRAKGEGRRAKEGKAGSTRRPRRESASGFALRPSPFALRRGSWTLLEMTVVLAIIAVLAVWLVPRYLGGAKAPGGGPAGRTVSAPVQRARGVECMNNLRQIRAAIQMAQATTETPPRSLAELSSSGVSGQILFCPVAKQPYLYDAATGRVACPFPEHRQY